MKTTKKGQKRNATGMDEKAKADWRAAKSAQLDGRVAALKKLAATPDTGARKPKRSYDAPADARVVYRPDGYPVSVSVPTDDPAPTATTAPVAEDAVTAPDGATNAEAPQTAPTPPGHGDAAAGGEHQPQDGGDQKKTRKPRGERKPREGGCLNAAARLLAEAPEPLGTKAMIEQMAAKGLWTSPGGKTPAATLHAAIIREIKDKGDASRFVKTGRGLFAAKK